jgi:hypothetical protein
MKGINEFGVKLEELSTAVRRVILDFKQVQQTVSGHKMEGVTQFLKEPMGLQTLVSNIYHVSRLGEGGRGEGEPRGCSFTICFICYKVLRKKCRFKDQSE